MDGSGDKFKDDMDEITMKVVPVVIVLISIVTTCTVTVSIFFCCWCYHHKKRKRDLAMKGGVIVLSEDLRRASSEGRLVVNVSLLDRTKVIQS